MLTPEGESSCAYQKRRARCTEVTGVDVRNRIGGIETDVAAAKDTRTSSAAAAN
jgi:hypothetical protein